MELERGDKALIRLVLQYSGGRGVLFDSQHSLLKTLSTNLVATMKTIFAVEI